MIGLCKEFLRDIPRPESTQTVINSMNRQSVNQRVFSENVEIKKRKKAGRELLLITC